MSMPTFSAWPPIPNRSAPEADFDAKMYAIFQHFAGTHRNEMLAFLNWLKTNSTVINGALNGTTIGLNVPAAAKFTSITGTAVSQTNIDNTEGSILKILGASGIFGLGADVSPPGWPNASLNDCTGVPAGIYTAVAATADKPNDEGGCLIFIPRFRTGLQFTQLFISTTGNFYLRASMSGGTEASPTWTWAKIPAMSLAGSLKLNDAILLTKRIVIADDTVATITPSYAGGMAMVMFDNNSSYPASNGYGQVYFDVGPSPACYPVAAGPYFATTTGVLTGTSGSDGIITMSAYSDGALYFENRSGMPRTMTVYIFS